MRTRIISAIVALVVFIPFLVLGGRYFAFCMWVIGLVGMYEFSNMQEVPFFNHIGLVACLALTAILVPTHYLPNFLGHYDWRYLYYLCCIVLLTFTVFNHRYFNFVDAAVLVLASIYIGFGFNFLILIRDMGLDTVFYLFIVIWSTDTGAYLIGRQLGKHPLAPDISPNKTIEGMIGGVLSAILISSVYHYVFHPNLGLGQPVWLLTIVISLFGQFGDLVESAFKRFFKVKDSGKLIPGHGGVLDRFDSIIFASFTLMIWLNFFR